MITAHRWAEAVGRHVHDPGVGRLDGRGVDPLPHRAAGLGSPPCTRVSFTV